MSRIGKQPVIIPDGVTVTQKEDIFHFKGPKGENSVEVHADMKVSIKDNQIIVERPSDERKHRSLHGLTRTLLANAVQGVKEGFVKKLEVQGVGYKANVQGTKLVLSLGLSHPVEYTPQEGVKVSMDPEAKKEIIIILEGVDKQKVGEEAAKIRKFRPPEPYKGKGIRYVGEYVRRKAGKAGIGGGAPGAA